MAKNEIIEGAKKSKKGIAAIAVGIGLAVLGAVGLCKKNKASEEFIDEFDEEESDTEAE